MDADGRIGGGMPEEEEDEDDFPFSVEELEAEDEVTFAEGGFVDETHSKVSAVKERFFDVLSNNFSSCFSVIIIFIYLYAF
jgi:hypothetical protein